MTSGEQTGQGPGGILAGRYRIERQLGRGGMGVVWQAYDENLGRRVAVKQLRTFSDSAAGELAEMQLRMQREARAAARVRHPGVIAVHDVAQTGSGPLIVMELIDGPSLDDVLREQGPLDVARAAAVGAEVLDALAAAHAVGVLHRDVKPGNILLDRSGRVVLTDFGIAVMEDFGDGATAHLTRSGDIVGSLDYLAPERAQGLQPGPASDVWALGATLYAALEGASPFRRTSTWSTLSAIVQEPLPPLRQGGALTHALGQLLQKEPQLRPDAVKGAALLRQVAAAAAGASAADAAPSGAAAPPHYVRTVAESRAVTVGFGLQAASTPQPPPPATGPGSTPSPVTTPEPRRARRAKVPLLAAVAVAAVLVAAGAGAALMGGDGTDRAGGSAEAGTSGSPSSEGERGSVGGDSPEDSATRGGGEDKEDEKDDKGPGKGQEGGKDQDPGSSEDGRPETSAPPSPDKPSSPDEGASGGGSTGGSEPAPPPACSPGDPGKHNCTVWRNADSYTEAGAKVGVLMAGTNYFFCQSDLGRRESAGSWTNTWWARTDDDSGNAGVWVNIVNIKGGADNMALPGLPIC